METLGIIVTGFVLMTAIIFIADHFEKRAKARKLSKQNSQRQKTRA